MAVFAVLVMLATALVPAAAVSDGATSWSGGSGSWKVVLHTEAGSNGYAQLTVHLYRNGSEVTDLEGIAQDAEKNATYTSNSKNADGFQKNAGSWGFGDDGYGPFNSFYAAFDPTNSNRLVCHLNPNNLKESVDGKTAVSIDGRDVEISDCNIMWCLPTVWWGTDSEGNLVMASSKVSDDMEAYAHTVGDTTYPYLAIGVYEASSKEVNGKTVLTSESGGTPLVSEMREVYRSYANNQDVSADGNDSGHAMLWNFYQYQLYRFCTLAVMGGWDSQSIAGNGSVYYNRGYSTYVGWAKSPGLLDESGPYAGTVGSGTMYETDSVKVFVENAWGSLHDLVDGIVTIDREYYVSQAAVPSDVNAESGKYSSANPPSGYSKIEGASLPDTYTWITSISTRAEIWGMPTGTNGFDTGNIYDQVWSKGGTSILFVGGCSHDNSSFAPWYGLSDVDASRNLSNIDSYIGGRLSFVFGADPLASVKYDHSQLQSLLEEYGYPESLISGLPDGPTGEGRYEQLGDVGDFRHIGWRIEIDGQKDVEVGPTDEFVARQSHTAVSLWSRIPTVTFDHSNLTGIVGTTAKGISDLQTSMLIEGDSCYPELPDIAGYRHVGWSIEIEGQGDVEVGPTDGLVSQQTHIAKSIWKRIAIPIIPDEGDADAIEVIVPDDSDHHSDNNSRTVILLAILVAIIAELAVLTISRRR